MSVNTNRSELNTASEKLVYEHIHMPSGIKEAKPFPKVHSPRGNTGLFVTPL